MNCQTITMADLERLEREVHNAFGRKPIWLTEYGYQTNPPDLFLGVTPEQQATYVANAALRVYRAASVEMLIFFMVRDDRSADGWQSGLFTVDGVLKPAYAAFRLPVLQTARHGGSVDLWGQVRPRSGRQPFRVKLEEDERDELDRRHPLDRRERVLLDLGRGAAGCPRPDLVSSRRRGVRARSTRVVSAAGRPHDIALRDHALARATV